MYDHAPLAFSELIADAPDRQVFHSCCCWSPVRWVVHARVTIACQIDHVPLV